MRFRRSTLALALLVLTAVTFGLAPYLTTASLVLLAWLLRAGSLAGSGHQWRRQRRGPKWYDAVLLTFAYPWCLLTALPGSVLLMFWAGGLALAAALLAFAAAAPLEGAVVGIGAAFAAATWWGPGGSRFRRPVQRAVHPLAGNPWVWLVASGCVFIVAAAVGWALWENGSDWTPAADRPLAPGSLLPRLFGR